ncbi:MAG: divalent-cation tolerance protein CutA [Desulfobacterales bacterium]|jgi:periplasmic divalent cation tolerance protein
MEVRVLYTTAGSAEEAYRIGRHLVENGLAACVNIFAGMHSLYLWDGELQDDAEVAMICKTTAERAGQAAEAIREAHSYDCPCVLSFPVVGGNPGFLEWIAAQVGSA